MLAATAARFAPDDPLSAMEIGPFPDPHGAPGWEIVRVKAASVNHHDLFTLRGVGVEEDRLPIVLGGDAAGTTADGRQVIVHSVIAGDGTGPETPDAPWSLLSEIYDGTHAELVAVPSRNLLDKPPELSFEEAACLPVAWLTAYGMLFVRGGFRPGQSVLVQGAGGGVATAATILGQQAGLRVYVTSRSPEKRQEAVKLGAHAAFEPGARLPERVDGVIETVGEATWAHSLRAVKAGGVIVVGGATSGANPPAELQRVFFRHVSIIGTTMGTKQHLVDLVEMMRATGIRPMIDSVLPLDEARQAYVRLVAGDVFGKIVLKV